MAPLTDARGAGRCEAGRDAAGVTGPHQLGDSETSRPRLRQVSPLLRRRDVPLTDEQRRRRREIVAQVVIGVALFGVAVAGPAAHPSTAGRRS